MPISASLKKNLYKDSVALMRIAQTILARAEVRRATLQMGTPANKAIMATAGLLTAELEGAAPGDVMIVVDAQTADAVRDAFAEIDTLLEGRPTVTGDEPAAAVAVAVRSIAMGQGRAGDAALAQISVPGPYAAAEAMKALRRGLHVFLFSDNVPIEQERAIKTLARAKGLLVMGPDCGTAILQGTPLGFANVVRRGDISVVGASGTGLQEVTCQIHALGQGIRHAIGTGSHDVSAEIGGSTLRQALDLLAADAGTRVVAIVSKAPAPEVARLVLEQAAALGKPVVVLFLGAELASLRLPAHLVVVETLADAAQAAVALADGRRFEPAAPDGAAEAEAERVAEAERRRFAPGQRDVRGLYSGGTFASEAELVWAGLGLPLSAHVAGAQRSSGNAAVDLGDDEFTVGKPHPMIDPSTRLERIAEEARDPATAVLVLDVVLGYGSHDDPAGALAPAIAAARAACEREGRHLSVVSFVCGTEDDPQRLSAQQATLRTAGAIVTAGSTEAARLAGRIGVGLRRGTTPS